MSASIPISSWWATRVGLAVVRELVAAHGGSATVDSDGRSGTTFTIRLPAAPSDGVV